MNDQLRPQGFTPTKSSRTWRIRDISIVKVIVATLLVAIAVVMWFLFTAEAIRFESDAANMTVTVSGGIVIPSGPSYLMRPGTYRYRSTAPQYLNNSSEFVVTDEANQIVFIEMQPKPGTITIESVPIGADVFIGDTLLGSTPLVNQLDAGEVEIKITLDRYQETTITETIAGKGQEQTIRASLKPDWAEVWIESTPTVARVSIDDKLTKFSTPGPIEVIAGERLLSIDSPGYKAWQDILFVRAGESIQLEPIKLKLVGGTLNISSKPAGATITVNDKYIGIAPVTIDVKANQRHTVKALLSGYREAVRRISMASESEQTVLFQLEPSLGEVIITTQPEDVEIWVDGDIRGASNSTLKLQDIEHEITLKKHGFADYRTTLTPRVGIPQELKIRLLTLEQARMEALKQVRTTIDGQELVLLEPATIRLGASRREPGRRANEVFRTTKLTRLFYMARYEVTNAQFRMFAPPHDSGSFQGVSLDRDNQPAVNVSWKEAAQYCNWLSEREGFDPFYIIEPGAEIIFDRNSLGYRLPTEAEWAWTARTLPNSSALLHFPWGSELPPPTKHGNYADRSSQHIIGRIIFDYNDNQIVSANVGSFPPNTKGVFDIGGNVAEWVHDYYGVPPDDSVVDELGSDTGEYHVIRGSSWKHGTITDLRFSFRDYGADGRGGVGFRIARYAE